MTGLIRITWTQHVTEIAFIIIVLVIILINISTCMEFTQYNLFHLSNHTNLILFINIRSSLQKSVNRITHSSNSCPIKWSLPHLLIKYAVNRMNVQIPTYSLQTAHEFIQWMPHTCIFRGGCRNFEGQDIRAQKQDIHQNGQ